MKPLEFESIVKNTIKKYKLANKKDKIIVACSGGKDSAVVAYILKKFGYNVEALHIDLRIGEWSEKNRKKLEGFCKENKIPLHTVDSKKEFGKPMPNLRSVVQLRTGFANCTVCGVIRRWLLNKKARELKATKLVTGHNMDDGAQTILMNIMRGNLHLCLGFGPKSEAKGEGFVTKIKPLYFCKERDIEEYSKWKNFPVIYKACPCSFDASRQPVKEWLWETEDKIEGTSKNIVDYHLKIKPKLAKLFKSEKIRHCKSCGEPTRKEICKACEFLKLSK